ncbi:hypothetical protein C5468_12885 [Photorhabdus luminescens subsp. mexicana]|uniref:Uncharacterized protein n=1 Tax=Photorhabdus luminescens subsp. mexicana TaxID=2100167 RepID=A0A4R4JAG1_PHOLU|nr:hypothetical protein C5468_12885 [Photorhabdus luminescens subsp. mexicana]
MPHLLINLLGSIAPTLFIISFLQYNAIIGLPLIFHGQNHFTLITLLKKQENTEIYLGQVQNIHLTKNYYQHRYQH